MTPLTGDIGQADLAVSEHYGGPRALLAAGLAELTQLITAASHHQQGCDRARQWRDAAAAELYQDHPAVPFAELAAEIATEIRLLRAIAAELAAHAAAREQHYLRADPGQLARSLPGFAEISAPILIAAMGRPGRFRDGTKFKSYAGLAPKASQTGQTGRKGQPMSKAGPSLLRATFFPRRRHRPPPRPPARQDLLHPDDRTRRHPPQGPLHRRRAPPPNTPGPC